MLRRDCGRKKRQQLRLTPRHHHDDSSRPVANFERFHNTAQVYVMVNAAPALHAFSTDASLRPTGRQNSTSHERTTAELTQWHSDVFARCEEINSQLDQIRAALKGRPAAADLKLRLVYS
jgi:hypothetical protein